MPMRVGCGRLRSMRLLHFAAALGWRLDVSASTLWATAAAGFGQVFPQLPMAALADLGVAR